MADLLNSFRDHLIAQNIVRRPSVAGSPPPMWLEPRNGVPAPGEGDKPEEVGQTLVLGAFMATGIPPRPYEGFIRTDGIEVVIRASSAALVKPLEESIREAVNDRRNYLLAGTLPIESSYLWRDLAPLERSPQAFSYNLSYIFALLAGGPLSPPTG